MLGNVQYTTFYKFLVSLGLVLMTLALVVPWLLLHESFDLLIKQADLVQLTPMAQSAIRHRQGVVYVTSLIAPWVSLGLFLSGVGLSTFGVIRWRGRQEIMDKTEDVSLEKLQREINLMPATPLERDTRQSQEAWQVVKEQQSALLPGSYAPGTRVDSNYRDLKQRIAILEDLAIAKLQAAFAPAYRFTPQMKLTSEIGTYYVDAVLKARNHGPDFIVEIKYVSQTTNAIKRIQEVVHLSRHLPAGYAEATGRSAELIVLVIVDRHLSGTRKVQLIQRIRRELERAGRPIRSAIVDETELRRMNPDDLRSMLIGDFETEGVAEHHG